MDHVYGRAYSPMVRCIGREYTPNRSAHVALLVVDGRLTWSPDVVEAMYWSFNSKIDQVWARDDSAPAFDIDEGEWNRAARADLVDAGAAPDWVSAFASKVRTSGNMFGLEENTSFTAQAEVLYVLDEVTRARAPEIGSSVQSLLDSAALHFATLEKGTDGWGLYDLGYWELAEESAKAFAGYIEESGASTVVANNSAVVYSLREWYPRLGLALTAQVVHHTEYFDQLGLSGALRGKATYHDSSYLARYLGVTDAPRNLLKNAGLELAECYFSGQKANPTGPLYGFFDDEYSRMVALKRAQELAVAAPLVVVSDPSSKWNLSAVGGDAGIEVQDIAEVLSG